MRNSRDQLGLFDDDSGKNKEPEAEEPAEIWEQSAAKRALDELFSLTFQYKASKSFLELLSFVSRFRFYSPFNAMLVHVQMPGATFVASPSRWLKDYQRRIKVGARPLVILQPMGPVMFVFDVSDTEPTENAPPLPIEVEKPFEVIGGLIGEELRRLIENAKRDGVRVSTPHEGSQSAGSIRKVAANKKNSQKFQLGKDKNKNPIFVDVPVNYELLINGKLSEPAQYVTMVHELAHLYCGHLGTPNIQWWPDRRGLSHQAEEFEAESVAYLVCSRAGIDSPSAEYLSSFVRAQDEVPPISFECVMKAAGLIETMSHDKLKHRKK